MTNTTTETTIKTHYTVAAYEAGWRWRRDEDGARRSFAKRSNGGRLALSHTVIALRSDGTATARRDGYGDDTEHASLDDLLDEYELPRHALSEMAPEHAGVHPDAAVWAMNRRD